MGIPLAGMMTAIILVVAPIWIVAHYVTQWRSAKTLSPEDEKMLSDLWDTLPKMESRINALERILDEEAPEWRKRI